jgi:hypothetical protein
LKRAAGLLRYEPNFPQGRDDVYIEVEIIESGRRFTFYPQDRSVAQITLVKDMLEFQAMFDSQAKCGGQGFKLRYVSKNGPGGWNTCSFSPIALDLDRNGEVEKIVRDAKDCAFKIDISGDGYIDYLNEWFGPKEGILIDMGSDDETIEAFSGTTITGQHLFGDMELTYDDGFDKLDEHDANKDGFVSGDELKGFAIWTDSNSNAQLDLGELSTLASHKIVSLNTKHDAMYESTALLSDGSTMKMKDLWFNRRR